MNALRRAMSLKRLGILSWLLVQGVLGAHADSTPAETAAMHYHEGLAYERLGRLDQAYTKLQLACVLQPNDAKMALALGVLALRLGKEEVAQRSLENSIIHDANSIASYYVLAMLYEKQKAWNRAIDSWNRFLELNRDDSLKIEAQKHLRNLEVAIP